MGIQASKQVGTILLSACKIAEEKGEDRIEIDDPPIDDLCALWSELPAELRNKIKATNHRAVKSITRLKPSTDLCPTVQSKLEDWSSNIERLFKDDPIPEPTPHANLVLKILSSLSVTESRPKVDEIRWRICTVVLFLIKCQISNSLRLSQDDGHIFTRLCVQLGAEEEHQTKVLKWANIGARYGYLASDLGGWGNLATLPHEGGRDLWENRLPKTGEDRNTSISLLQEKGVPNAARKIWKTPINKEICADDAVESILKMTLERVNPIILQTASTMTIEPGKKDRTLKRQRKTPKEGLNSRSKRKKSSTGLRTDADASVDVGVQGPFTPQTSAGDVVREARSLITMQNAARPAEALTNQVSLTVVSTSKPVHEQIIEQTGAGLGSSEESIHDEARNIQEARGQEQVEPALSGAECLAECDELSSAQPENATEQQDVDILFGSNQDDIAQLPCNNLSDESSQDPSVSLSDINLDNVGQLDQSYDINLDNCGIHPDQQPSEINLDHIATIDPSNLNIQ